MPVSHPEATVVRVRGVGLDGPCPARNRAIREARTDWVFLIDDDAFPEPGCIKRLIEEARAHPEADVVSPRVLRSRDLVHYDGARVHFLGEACFENYLRRAASAAAPSPAPDAASTTALLLRRQAALEWGLFDESLVFFREDVEFFLRARLLGGVIRHCPEAVVVHDQGARGPLHALREYYQARNRWRLMLKLYETRTLLMTLPLQLAFEALGFARSVRFGRGVEHVRGLVSVAVDFPSILEGRRAFQARRRLTSGEVLCAAPLSWRAETRAIRGAASAARLLDSVCSLWWRACSRLLR
ncbi:MAG: glycosyltransferase [Elusimicrobia bacterium]|nr:glycosyltransferase [Elusimicrobiota bacterium]